MSAFNHSLRLGAASMLVMLLGSYVFATDAAVEESRDISRINRSISIDSEEIVGDLSSVNGGIRIAGGASAEKVSTVNGSVDIDDGVQLRSATTVNGGISVGSNVSISDSLETVNGGISTRNGTTIGGSVETVNGRVRLRNTEVGGNVETSNGDIDVLDGSWIEGDIVIKGRRHWWDRFFDFSNRLPEITIDFGSEVIGDIHLYREVELNIANGALAGDVIAHF